MRPDNSTGSESVKMAVEEMRNVSVIWLVWWYGERNTNQIATNQETTLRDIYNNGFDGSII